MLDSVPGFSVVVPGHPAEVEALLRGAVGALDAGSTYLRLSTETNLEARPVSASLQVVRSGRRAVVVAVGPMLSPVLEAVADLDVTVAYATTVRPFDAAGLRAAGGGVGGRGAGRAVPGRDVFSCRGLRADLATAPAAEPGRAANGASAVRDAC